ncbi:MAG TPA: PEP-CTERM sorting domain-containing protein [Allocoleopsis sp.]
MKISTFKTLLGAAATLCVLSLAQPVRAASLYNNWNYSIDSFTDGTEGSIIGDRSKFEFYGMAYREMGDRVYFAMNSNLSTSGYAMSGARNGKISYGDLFLNFNNPSNFNQANNNLFGIRFDSSNDTTFKLGLYGNVQATSLTNVNNGYTRMADHTQYVNSSPRQGAPARGFASYGDLAANTTYFNSQQAAPTTIKAGTFLGAISSMISQADLSSMGLDFSHFNAKGKYTFGFSVDKALLPEGNFVASLFAECGNDGMAMTGDLQGVPEPSSLAGLVAVVGLVAAGKTLRRRQQDSVA